MIDPELDQLTATLRDIRTNEPEDLMVKWSEPLAVVIAQILPADADPEVAGTALILASMAMQKFDGLLPTSFLGAGIALAGERLFNHTVTRKEES